MKPGDIIEWNTINGIGRGIVEVCETDPDGFIVRLPSGAVFTLDELRHSKSAKIIEI